MKLDITEVHFVKTAIEASTIKASDAFFSCPTPLKSYTQKNKK